MSVLINFLLQNTNLVSILSKICPNFAGHDWQDWHISQNLLIYIALKWSIPCWSLTDCTFTFPDEIDILGYGSGQSDTDDHSSIESGSDGFTGAAKRLVLNSSSLDCLWGWQSPVIQDRMDVCYDINDDQIC